MKLQENVICVYHDADVDGVLSAALIQEIFRKNNIFKKKKSLKFIPYNYQDELKIKVKENTDILFVDCTPPASWLDYIDSLKEIPDNCTCTIIDHHMNRLIEIESKCEEFGINVLKPNKDKKISSCGLIYNHFKNDMLSHLNDYQIEMINSASKYDSWDFNIFEEEYLELLMYQEVLKLHITDIEKMNNFIFEYLKYISQEEFEDIKLIAYGMFLQLKNNTKIALKNSILLDNGIVVGTLYPSALTELYLREYFGEKAKYYISVNINLQESDVKISIRNYSESYFNAISILSQLNDFKGGGHADACGAKYVHLLSEFNFQDFLNKVEQIETCSDLDNFDENECDDNNEELKEFDMILKQEDSEEEDSEEEDSAFIIRGKFYIYDDVN